MSLRFVPDVGYTVSLVPRPLVPRPLPPSLGTRLATLYVSLTWYVMFCE